MALIALSVNRSNAALIGANRGEGLLLTTCDLNPLRCGRATAAPQKQEGEDDEVNDAGDGVEIVEEGKKLMNRDERSGRRRRQGRLKGE